MNGSHALLLFALLLALFGCASDDGFAPNSILAGPGAPVDVTLVGMDTVRGASPRVHDLVLTFEVANMTNDELTVKALLVSQNSHRDYENSATSSEKQTIARNAEGHLEVHLRARYHPAVRDEELEPRRPNARDSMRLHVVVRLVNGDQIRSAFEIPVPLTGF